MAFADSRGTKIPEKLRIENYYNVFMISFTALAAKRFLSASGKSAPISKRMISLVRSCLPV